MGDEKSWWDCMRWLGASHDKSSRKYIDPDDVCRPYSLLEWDERNQASRVSGIPMRTFRDFW